MTFKCPKCGKKYDAKKDCGLATEKLDKGTVITATIACDCGAAFDLRLSKPEGRGRISRLLHGTYQVEVTKRGD